MIYIINFTVSKKASKANDDDLDDDEGGSVKVKKSVGGVGGVNRACTRAGYDFSLTPLHMAARNGCLVSIML